LYIIRFYLIIIVIIIIFSNHQEEDYDDHQKADDILETESLHSEIYEDTKKLSFNKTSLQASPYSSEEDGLINNDDELTEEDDEFEKSEINDGMLKVTLLIVVV
jgi:hypothetical protein